MFANHYYCLVAGLKEYTLDADIKGFDAPALIAEIREGVSPRDRKQIALLYSYYDIENIISLRAGRDRFSALGNFSREELEEELKTPSRLPAWMQRVIAACRRDEEGEEETPEEERSDESFERRLLAAYYAECARCGSRFLREWAAFDRTLRNITAAFAARRLGFAPAESIVGSGEIETALARSSAADFGIRNEVDYVDQVIAVMGTDVNLLEKEHRLDALRWSKAEELACMHYFDLDFLLGYLVRINLIHRWAALDPERGRRMLDALMGSFREAGRTLQDDDAPEAVEDEESASDNEKE